jgi:hypothetical protein
MRAMSSQRALIAVCLSLTSIATLAVASPAAAQGAPGGAAPSVSAASSATSLGAAAIVREFVAADPQPRYPGASAPYEVHERYATARLEWLERFPFEAGVRQWGCTLSEVVHIPVGSTVTQPAHVDTAMVVGCQEAGTVPALAAILAPRSEVDEPSATGEEPAATCADLRQGRQCLTVYPIDQNTTSADYTWNGSTPIVGRIRIEQLPPIWPSACGVGTHVASGPLLELKPGQSTALFTSPAPGIVRSAIWDEANASGGATVRSVLCVLEPAQPRA